MVEDETSLEIDKANGKGTEMRIDKNIRGILTLKG